MHHDVLRAVALAGLALTVAACGMSAVSGPPAPAPGTPPVTDRAPGSTPDPSFEALVAAAIEFRRTMGLRSDEAWAREVANDPGARNSYGVPLTVVEENELNDRAATAEELAPILQEYGEQQAEEFAGLFIDQERGGIIVVLFTDRLAEHGAAIAGLVHPGAPIEVRQAPAAEQDLMALMDRITRDEAALRGLGVFAVTTALDTEASRVEVGVSTERGDAQGLMTALYGPTVVVRVIDPSGAFLKPRGVLTGRVTDGAGRGVAASLGTEPLFGDIPMDSMARQTAPDGTFRLDGQLAGPWRVTAFADGFAPASVEVEVPPGGVATVELVLVPES